MKSNLSKKIWNKKVIQNHNRKKLGYGDIQYLYGEITKEGFDELIKYIKDSNLIENKWNLLDAGSGFGKLVFYAALFENVESSTGVECIEEYHKIAENNLKELGSDFPISKVRLICKYIKDFKSFKYNVIFSNNISWDDESIMNTFDINRDALFITSKNPENINCIKIKEINKLNIKCSWGDQSKIYIFRLDNT